MYLTTYALWPRRAVLAASSACVLIGALTLAGWVLNVPTLKSVLPGLPAMTPLTAVLILVAAIGIGCVAPRPLQAQPPDSPPNPQARQTAALLPLAFLCAALVAGLGLFRLAAHIAGWHLGIDLLLFAQSPDARPVVLAPATAFGLTFIGLALLLSAAARLPRAFHVCVFFAAGGGWIGFSHYLYGGVPLLPYAQMAPQTAVALLLLTAGVLNTRPELGLVALLASDSAGGAIARRLVPAALFVPLAFGWFCLQAQRAGWIGTEAGVALVAVANILVFGGLIWSTAAGLHSSDTQRKLGAERLQRQASLFDQSYDAIIVWEWDGAITFWNRAAEQIYGFTASQALGQVSHRLLQTSAPGGWASVLRRLEQGGRWEGELQHTCSDGKRIVVESRMARASEGSRLYVLETIRDIGDRRTLEQQLRQSQKMEGIGRLAGGIAHDFNNLLGVIIACADLLSTDEDLQSVRSRTAEIRKSAERAARLTRQLLAFSRKQVLAPKVVDLNVVLAEMSQMLERVLGEDVQFRMLASPDLGRVLVDPSQIEQVLLNLVVNARDAMPNGGKITLETQNVELTMDYVEAHPEVKPGSYVMVGATDSGVGMDHDTQVHIFEPFYTTKVGGTGLGLAMVYGIVKQSGGHIWVYSEPERGTTFKLYFPRVDDPLPAPELEKQTLEAAPATETVLLVEDFESLRLVTQEFLEMTGYTVVSASNAGEALHAAASHQGPIHLLLTDVVMPGVSGVDLARQIKAIHPRIHILYMSGYTANAVVHQGVLDKGLTLLSKPFTRTVLAQKVREVLDAEQPVQ